MVSLIKLAWKFQQLIISFSERSLLILPGLYLAGFLQVDANRVQRFLDASYIGLLCSGEATNIVLGYPPKPKPFKILSYDLGSIEGDHGKQPLEGSF